MHNIGIISQKNPLKVGPLLTLSPTDTLIWFEEWEAAYAYLLHSFLELLFFDAEDAQDQRYQKLFALMHPRMKIDSLILADKESTFRKIIHFPNLEKLFGSGELSTAFQPIICQEKLKKPFIIGFECLLRLKVGEVSYQPEILFHYAQEKLKLSQYERIGILHAIAEAPKNVDGLVFINVRPESIVSSAFLSWFLNSLEKVNINPHRIVIEITEQQGFVAERELEHCCKLFRNAGLRFALDDFGSGISNLNLLSVVKPEYLKISGKFVNKIHEDRTKQIMAKTLLKLAEELEISPIVENVESEHEWHHLVSSGAKLAQGFYFHKPMDAKSLHALL